MMAAVNSEVVAAPVTSIISFWSKRDDNGILTAHVLCSDFSLIDHLECCTRDAIGKVIETRTRTNHKLPKSRVLYR